MNIIKMAFKDRVVKRMIEIVDHLVQEGQGLQSISGLHLGLVHAVIIIIGPVVEMKRPRAILVVKMVKIVEI